MTHSSYSVTSASRLPHEWNPRWETDVRRENSGIGECGIQVQLGSQQCLRIFLLAARAARSASNAQLCESRSQTRDCANSSHKGLRRSAARRVHTKCAGRMLA